MLSNLVSLACAVTSVIAFRAAAQDAPATAETSFDRAAATAQQQLQQALDDLTRLRDEIAAEKIPLSRRLSERESELTGVRQEFQQITRLLDNRTLDLNNLRNEIKAREEEGAYLSNLLGEYLRNFESRLHIAELQRYKRPLEQSKLVAENSNLEQQEVFAQQTALLTLSLDRLDEALGGVRFEGSAVDASGMVNQGTFVLVGPVALFRSTDGRLAGIAEQRLGSLEPTVLAFENPETIASTVQVVTESRGIFPLDSSLGNAHKIAATKESLWEHIKKGGPVMVPIFALAGAALMVAIYKWASLMLVRAPSRRRIHALLSAVARRDRPGVEREARAIRGPVGRMLRAGIAHLDAPRELIEEIMYEQVLSTRLRLQRMLPFIAIAASAAPLLGLLGTVTGIMNTFKLITVFGTGDVKTLSSGISEALITTEYGLIVAIPSLLLHAFLSRKAKRIVDQMEKAAIALLNQVGKTPWRQERAAPSTSALLVEPPPPAGASKGSAPTVAQVKGILADILEPLVHEDGPSRAQRRRTSDALPNEQAVIIGSGTEVGELD